MSSAVMSSLAVPPLTVKVPGWGGGLVIWLHLGMPTETAEKLLWDNASGSPFSFPGRWTASTCK